MASAASRLIEEVAAHAQSDSLEDAREICADGTYFPNYLRSMVLISVQLRLICVITDGLSLSRTFTLRADT
jgi:hypothetical protein